MKQARPIIVIVILVGVALIAWYLLGGSRRERMLSGYIRREYR